MQKIYKEVNSLDKRCYEKFYLSEDILMENAALAITNYIKDLKKTKIKKQKLNILIAVGKGNNGADGITVARQLFNNDEYEILVFEVLEIDSGMASLQKQRAQAIGVNFVSNLKDINITPDIIIDAIFGSGLARELNDKIKNIIDYLNNINCYKIACDIPSGIISKYKNKYIEDGYIKDKCFYADVTITMGALKTQLFNDNLKDFIGEIIVADLGIDKSIYHIDSNMYLLQDSDLKLPIRKQHNTHKGSFGHILTIAGDKQGACILASMGALHFGVGLCTILSSKDLNLDPILMQCNIDNIPNNINSIIIGMGLGDSFTNVLNKILNIKCPKVFDADILYNKIILKYLNNDIILTPHPKEFISLLRLSNIANIDIQTLQNNRIKYAKLFCEKYPNIVLVLKGANVIIAQNNKLYINSLGSSALSKGGSGDVLSGMIGALLAQKDILNFTILECALFASLAHAKASKNYIKEYTNYSMIPYDIINFLKKL